MKTINELCEQYGVSRQTIYNAVKKTGKKIEDLTVKKKDGTRLFTEEGVKALHGILSKRCKAVKEPCKVDTERVKELTEQLENKRLEAENLIQKLTQAEEQTRSLTAELERKEKQAEDLTARLEQAEQRINVLTQTTATQALTIQNMQKTPALLAQEERKPGRIRQAWRILIGKGDG